MVIFGIRLDIFKCRQLTITASACALVAAKRSRAGAVGQASLGHLL